MAGIIVTTPPSGLLVTLATQKAYMRIDTAADDTVITEMIQNATDYLERETRQVFITRTCRQYFDGFPFLSPARDTFGVAIGSFNYGPYGYGGPVVAPPASRPPFELKLDGIPLASVADVRYVFNGSTVTWAGSNYTADAIRKPGRVCLNINSSGNTTWPQTDPIPNSVWVDFNCGYDAAQGANIPPVAVQAVRWIVAHYYENREAFSEATFSELPAVRACVEQLKFSESFGA